MVLLFQTRKKITFRERHNRKIWSVVFFVLFWIGLRKRATAETPRECIKFQGKMKVKGVTYNIRS